MKNRDAQLVCPYFSLYMNYITRNVYLVGVSDMLLVTQSGISS